jgi:hypothetical protein
MAGVKPALPTEIRSKQIPAAASRRMRPALQTAPKYL